VWEVVKWSSVHTVRKTYGCLTHAEVNGWDSESVAGWLKLSKLDEYIPFFLGSLLSDIFPYFPPFMF
jgi:hypothetical protein